VGVWLVGPDDGATVHHAGVLLDTPACRRALPTRRMIPASVPPSMTVAPVTVSHGIRTSANGRS
jgi:hypothetical protein